MASRDATSNATQATMTLRELLENPNAFDWRMMVYAPPPRRTFDLEIEVLVLPTLHLAPDEIPAEAARRGLEEFMTVDQIQDIFVALGRAGLPDPTMDQRLSAFRYYVENDAFINPADAG